MGSMRRHSSGRLRLRLERLQVREQPVGGDPLVREADALAPALVDQQRVGAVLVVEAADVPRAAAIGAVADRRVLVVGTGRRRPVLQRLLARLLAAVLAVLLQILLVLFRGLRLALLARRAFERDDPEAAPDRLERVPAAEQDVDRAADDAHPLQPGLRPLGRVVLGVDRDRVDLHAAAGGEDRLLDLGGLARAEVAAARVDEGDDEHLAACARGRAPGPALVAQAEVRRRPPRYVEARGLDLRGRLRHQRGADAAQSTYDQAGERGDDQPEVGFLHDATLTRRPATCEYG